MGLDVYGSNSLKDNVLWRAGLFTGSLWINSALRFYSHEVAHEYVYRANHVKIRNSLDFKSWKSSYVPGIFYPSWTQPQIDANLLDEKELISATIAGLNQDELNAEAVWRSSLSRNAISFYDAQSYLLTKFRDVEYIFKSGSDEAPFAPGQQIHQLQYDVYAETPHLFDDVNLYRLALLNNGHSISNQQLMNRALFADLLSWHTWENMWAAVTYLIKGQESHQPFFFAFDENVRLSPPFFSHFMTSEGSFFNSTYLLELKQNRFQIHIGSMIGFTSINAFQHYRIGVKAMDSAVMNAWHVRPYIFFNGRSGTHFDGHSVGIENRISFAKKYALTLKLEHNKNDLFENQVKRERHGFQTVLGMQIIF